MSEITIYKSGGKMKKLFILMISVFLLAGVTSSAHAFLLDPVAQPGSASSVMWIQTNAPQYTTGSLSFIDEDVARLQAYHPINVIPEPMSLSLLGSGLLGIIRLRGKRAKKKQR